MAFLFGRNKPRGASDLCKATKELLLKLNSDEPTPPKVEEELSKNLAQMKLTVQGTPEQEVSQPAVHQLVESLASEDVLLSLVHAFPRLAFDPRKDAQAVLCSVFRFRVPFASTHTNQYNGSNQPILENDPLITIHIVNDRPEIIPALCRGYQHKQSAMPCGIVLREAIKHDSMAALILYDEPLAEGEKNQGLKNINPNEPASGNGVFWKFFEWIDKGAFEISTDAFSTFSDLLKKHKKLASHYLLTNYTRFTETYNAILVQSKSYVTKRQSIKLLSEILLERANYNLMMTYVASGSHLKISMQLLRDEGRMVQYEGFHIFKIFVANPNKSEEVRRILINNKHKLLRYLPDFMEDRADTDSQFFDEKAYLQKQIAELPDPPPAVQRAAQGAKGTGVGGAAVVAAGHGSFIVSGGYAREANADRQKGDTVWFILPMKDFPVMAFPEDRLGLGLVQDDEVICEGLTTEWEHQKLEIRFQTRRLRAYIAACKEDFDCYGDSVKYVDDFVDDGRQYSV